MNEVCGPDSCYDVDESDANWKKLSPKTTYHLNPLIYEIYRISKGRETEGGGGEQEGNLVLSFFQGRQNALKLDCGDGFTALWKCQQPLAHENCMLCELHLKKLFK